MKKCSKCGKKKPYSQFFEVKARKSYTAACKNCHGKKEKKCDVCGEKYIGSSNQRFCGEKCRKINRPRTSLRCKACNKEFYADRLNKEYCSRRCWYDNVPKRVNYTWEYKRKARNCASRTRYLITKGELIRPRLCEECGVTDKPIEAAHYNYDDAKRVRWLCRSCHVRWDKREPKGACKKKNTP